MKSLSKILIFSVVITITSLITSQQTKAQVTVGFQVFYDDLSPYGTWVNNPEYGYVWYPNAGADFTPYGSNGYWAMTDAGWTWVSYYPWGWAPFHYGRWYDDPMYGNMWVPGNEWGPGWVCWRQSEGYYGWAPIGPGISLEVAYGSNYNVRNDQWRFVRNGDFGREHINNYYVDRSTNVTIIKNTTVINNSHLEGGRSVTYNAGPKRADAEKRAGKTFTPVAIKDNAKHGETMGKSELQIYRPQVQKSNTAAKKEAPAKVVAIKDLKPQKAGSEKAAEPAKQQPAQQKAAQPAKQQPAQQKNPVAPAKQEPTQTQQKNQPAHQQPTPQKAPVPPARQEPQPPHKTEPARQQPPQPPVNNKQPEKQQPAQQPKENGLPYPQQQKTNPAPHQEQPRQQPPKQQEPAKQEPPRQEPPREEPPRQEPPQQPHLEGEGNRPH